MGGQTTGQGLVFLCQNAALDFSRKRRKYGPSKLKRKDRSGDRPNILMISDSQCFVNVMTPEKVDFSLLHYFERLKLYNNASCQTQFFVLYYSHKKKG